MLGPILRSDEVCLEPPRLEDMPTYLSWRRMPEVSRFLWGPPSVSSLRQQEEWFEHVARAEDEVAWRIVVDDRTVGRASIFGIDWLNCRGETSTVIGDPSLWRRGIGTAVVRLRCWYSFEELGLERLETISLIENIGMHRALERSGYRNLTRLHRFVFRQGRWHDVYLFELLRSDWRAQYDSCLIPHPA